MSEYSDDALDKYVDEYIAELVDAGALAPSGVSESGEFLYSMDAEKMIQQSPEFFAEAFRRTEDAIISLQNKGLVEYIEEGPDGTAVWDLTLAGTFHYESIEQAVYGEAEKLYED